MKDVARLLGDMLAAGVIRDYAVFGAVAQMRYTEAIVTFDADILVAVGSESAVDILGPLYRFCESRGYTAEGEAVRVGDWPVQFIPTFSSLTEEAVRCAEVADIDGVPLRVVRAEHLAAIALQSARPKDFARVLALLESKAVDREALAGLASRHGLSAAWERFVERFLA